MSGLKSIENEDALRSVISCKDNRLLMRANLVDEVLADRDGHPSVGVVVLLLILPVLFVVVLVPAAAELTRLGG